MNIVIAPDSFKGSITALQASEIMGKAVQSILEDCYIHLRPMADGGEGTLESMKTALDGREERITCTGPLGHPIHTSYAIVADNIAIIECANIAGLTQVPLSSRNPDHTTTYGIGEVIIDALDKGCTSLVMGLGGSATNDGGLGMLQALGMKAYDTAGQLCGPFGKDLFRVASVDMTRLDSRLAQVHIQVANDVDNPLCGDKGASAVYGPQKGADKQQVVQYDNALKAYGKLVESTSTLHQTNMEAAGAGAAGGLGFALLSLGAELVSGAKLVAEHIGLEAVIKQADLVLTGEGQSDQQTMYGKAPGYVAELAARYHVPTVLISGALSDDSDVLRKQFAGCFSIAHKPMTLGKSIEQTETLLYRQTQHIMHFWRNVQR
ncbi:glycerate kinase [Lentibacillus saliphilus]|uniref:glycerate kinase n=1 Tax=Lentibacillus saliphilus TaxID=2737028 RepID=UPI001C3004A1|nr:glycerate kinase [Lentibacillus saliphilus]